MTMTDLRPAIAPKSDQLNADDLIGGPMTIIITKVSVISGEQPISVSYEGDRGKPWKPCKSMGRVLVLMWGADGKAYTGRSVTLYRDPSVRFGPETVGGIRISHMSHIDGDRTVALTTTRGRRAPYTVKQLAAQNAPARAPSPPPSSPALQWDGALIDPDAPQAIDVFPGASAEDWRNLAKVLRAAIKRASSPGLAMTWLDLNESAIAAHDPRLVEWIKEVLPAAAPAA
jgi:hypothetical protein